MSNVLYNIIVAPIELVVEVVFEIIYRFVGHDTSDQVIAIIGVSFVISLLTFPLYRMADSVQKKERDIQNSMSKWITHIRKSFKGDERFMMQQYYYKIQRYNPIQSLNGSLSLLLQIPFFMAAYHFLSNLEILQGTRVGPINNLGLPDGLLIIGPLSINILPILMTIINCISSAIYLKGFPVKDKIKTYLLAIIFLILLYKSPSGLVIYWTCNNLFSLLKNIFYKLKNPKKVITILCSIGGWLTLIFALVKGRMSSTAKIIFTLGLVVVCNIPILIQLLKKINCRNVSINLNKNKIQVFKFRDFILPALLITVVMGVLIPSNVISSSPTEFIDFANYRNPLLYLINTICYAIGFFFFWSGLLFYILSEKGKQIFSLILWISSGIFLVDYLFFSNNIGILSPLLIYDKRTLFTFSQKIVNLFVLMAITGVLFYLFKFKKVVYSLSLVLILSTSVVSLFQIYSTQTTLKEMSYMKNMSVNSSKKKIYKLSKTGKNVIVIVLDRAINGYVPYILEEKQELKKQFEGFTYYPNTLSFGFWTLLCSPSLYGGYEYTPMNINKRTTETLADKHNESLKVMPVLFDNNNFNVTVCDLPHAGYKDIPDFSIFSDYPNIDTHITRKVTINENLLNGIEENPFKTNERNFFFYSIFRVSPLILSQNLYNEGNYLSSAETSVRLSEFFKEISLFTLLSDLTEISDENKNTYLSIYSMVTHEPKLLQLPDYELKQKVNNSGFQTVAEKYINMKKSTQIEHYHCNVAAFIQLGKWFDFMRENQVWDNTRIIVVADHGGDLGQFDYMLMNNPKIDVQACNPLLMVKDFNSKKFTVDNSFMTNADVPVLSCKDLIENPVNPFTGKKIDSTEKTAHPQVVVTKTVTSASKNNQFGLTDECLLTVHDNIFDENNWEKVK